MKRMSVDKVIIVALLAMAVLLAACGGGEEPTPVPPTPTQVTIAPTATPAPAIQPTPTRPPAVVPTPTPAVEQPKYGGILRVSVAREPEGLDLHDRRSSSNWYMTIPQMSYLVQNYQAGEGVAPDLAERWEFSQDGKTITFHLVRNAKWHDGKPVTSADIVYSINRIAFDPKLPNAAYRFTMAPLESIEPVDDFTVRMNLKTVSASFLPGLGAIGNIMYPAHVPIAQFREPKPVGSGPFKFVSYTPGSAFVLTKNPDYFKKDANGRQLPYLDSVTVFIIPDRGATFAAFRTGRLDIPHGVVDPELLRGKDEVLQRDLGVPAQVREAGYWPVWFNVKVAPFNDVRVRRAIHLAVNRQEFEDVASQGKGTPYMMYSVPQRSGGKWALPEEEVKKLPGFRPDKTQDVAEAKRLLQQAGIDPAKFTPTFTVRQIYEAPAVTFLDQLKKQLGITAKVRIVDNVTMLETQRKGTFEANFDANSAAMDDPSAYFPPFFRTGGSANYGGWGDPELDRLIDSLDTTLDTKKRLELSRQVELKLLDLAWAVPFGSNPGLQAWSKNVRTVGWLHSQDGPGYRYEQVWLAAP